MDAPAPPSLHHHVTFPTLASLIRLLPLFLLFFLTTPHGLADHLHAFYMRRPYAKPSPRDAFPSKDGDINLSQIPIRLNLSSQHHRLHLDPGTSLYASVRAPALCTRLAPCFALVEAWYSARLPREQKPDPYLLAANGTIPQPFPFYPDSRIVGDDEAFYTWRPYHFIQLASVTAEDQWHIRLLNHDATVFNTLNASLRVTIARDPRHPLCPRGTGNAPCSGRGVCSHGECDCNPGYGGRYCETVIEDLPNIPFDLPADGMRVFRYDAPREAHVTTELRLLPPQAVTSAAHPILFAKRFGENGGRKLVNGPPLPTIYDEDYTDRMAVRAHLPIQRIITRDVDLGETIYIAVYNFRASAPAWLVRRHPNLRTTGMMQRRAVRVRLRVFPCADELIDTPLTLARQLDTEYGGQFARGLREQGRHFLSQSLQSRRESNISTNSINMIRRYVHANKTGYNKTGYTLGQSSLIAGRLRRCPSHARDWDYSMTVLLGPLLLGSLTLLTMFVCVSVWAGVFRQHLLETMGIIAPDGSGDGGGGMMSPATGLAGGGPGGGGVMLLTDTTIDGGGMNHDRDKLTQEEIEAMFQAFRFTKGVTQALCAVGDASCSVCLCAFEEHEELRRLACGHSYHAHCIDQWLVMNASCPRCRMKARISGDMLGRSRLAVRMAAVRNTVGAVTSTARALLANVRTVFSSPDDEPSGMYSNNNGGNVNINNGNNSSSSRNNNNNNSSSRSSSSSERYGNRTRRRDEGRSDEELMYLTVGAGGNDADVGREGVGSRISELV